MKKHKHKKPRLSISEQQRLSSINSTMDGLYDSVDAVSESLVDQEYVEALRQIRQLKKKIADLETTLR